MSRDGEMVAGACLVAGEAVALVGQLCKGRADAGVDTMWAREAVLLLEFAEWFAGKAVALLPSERAMLEERVALVDGRVAELRAVMGSGGQEGDSRIAPTVGGRVDGQGRLGI